MAPEMLRETRSADVLPRACVLHSSGATRTRVASPPTVLPLQKNPWLSLGRGTVASHLALSHTRADPGYARIKWKRSFTVRPAFAKRYRAWHLDSEISSSVAPAVAIAAKSPCSR